MTDAIALWERHAAWWQRGFTDGADPEYAEQILPLVAGCLDGADRVLDIGCGEGQVSRLAAAVASDLVVGVDPAWAQVSAAASHNPAGRPSYARATAAGLPFAGATFDAVVACLVFEHVLDPDEALAEVARVLEPGGRFVFLVNHPLIQTPGSGWVDDRVVDPPQQYWRLGSYLEEVEETEEVEPGIAFRFVHRPLSRYVNAMVHNGLVITHMEEPAPPPGYLARIEESEAAATIPRLLLLVTQKNTA